MVAPADLLLTDRVAVVTGAGAGIGRGIAVGFAALGADLVIAEVDRARAEDTAAAVRAAGREAVVALTDVMDPEAVRRMVADADHRFGRIDIVVNNAGGVRGRPFLEQSEKSWRRHIDLNLGSALAVTQAAVPVMIRAGRGGAIVNVASIEAFRAAPGYAVYAACKAAMTSLTRSLALEFAEHGIRVNAIAPDQTETAGLHGEASGAEDPSRWPEPTRAQRDARARQIPLGRWGHADECARVAAFLASDLASYVTGVTVPVDGGTWASSGWVRSPDGDGWTLIDPMRTER